MISSDDIVVGMTSRTLIALGEERVARLDRLAEQRGQSRSSLIRMAVDHFLEGSGADAERARKLAGLHAGFGAWKHRTDIGDAVELQRRMRAEWTRPWDPDYEEVRAEFPDLFDDDDDREHARYKAGG